MADTPVQFEFAAGETLTVELHDTSDAATANSPYAAAEEAHRDGLYEITVDDAVTGLHRLNILSGGVSVGSAWVFIAADDATTYTASRDRCSTEIKAKTDNLPASPAATGDAMTLEAGERETLAGEVNDAMEAGQVGIDAAAAAAGAGDVVSGVVDDAAPGVSSFGISGVTNMATGAYEQKFLEVAHGTYAGETRRVTKTTLVAGKLVLELERALPGAPTNGGAVRLVGGVA